MERLVRSFEWVLSIASGLALVAMMLLTICDVIGRYFFQSSIFGTSEYIEYLMVVVVFAGIAIVTARDQHIKVELFDHRLRAEFPRLMSWMSLVFSAALSGLIVWSLARRALDDLDRGKLSIVLELPDWLKSGAAALFICIGLVLLIVVAIITRGRPHLMVHGPDSGSVGAPDEGR